VSLIYPFGRDQGSYGYAGWVLLEGGVPYRDVFVLKPPMTVAVHCLAMGLFGVNTWAIRALDIAWTGATALLLAAVSLELWKRRDAAFAAGLTLPFLYYQVDYWNLAQTDGWMTLPCTAAIWAVLRGGRALGYRTRSAVEWWIAAGVLVGVAVLFKYTAAVIGLPMLLALGWAAAIGGRRAWLGVPAMIFGGVLVLGRCWAWLAGTGAWEAFLDSQLGLLPSYIAHRADSGTVTQTLARLIHMKGRRLDLMPLFWAGPVFFWPALLTSRRGGQASWWGLGIAVTWWLAAVGNVTLQGKFFDYHYLPLMAPSALIAGLGLAVVLRRPLSWLRRREIKGLALVGLVVILIAVTPIGVRAWDLARVAIGGQTIEEYIRSRREYALPAYNVDDIRRVAKLLRETTTADQRVFLWGFEPTINVRAHRRTMSRFLYNYPLRASWGNPEYEAELMGDLRARPPDVFVVASGDRYPGLTGTYKDSAALLRDFDELDTFLQERYVPAESVGRYSIWRLKKAPRNR